MGVVRNPGDEPRTIVTVTATSRDPDPRDPDGRARVRRDCHVTLNFPTPCLGESLHEAVRVGIEAAEPTGILGEGVDAVEVRVEWDGVE